MPTAVKALLALFAVIGIALGDPVLHAFKVWPALKTYQEKASLYHGWTNGFLSASRHDTNQKQLKRIRDFGECLENKISYPQAVAMIDKYYTDHPEFREQPLPEMLLDALTAQGSPCEGKNPYQ
jgi:hypothetical protein